MINKIESKYDLMSSKEILLIIKVLYFRPGISIADLVSLTGKSNATISEQLKPLIKSKIVIVEKRGKFKHLLLNEEKMKILFFRKNLDQYDIKLIFTN